MHCIKILTLFFIFSTQIFGQNIDTTIIKLKKKLNDAIVVKNFLDKNFTFTKKWNYLNGDYKDANGKFYTDGSKLYKTYIHYTANCKTNIQGGFTFKNCHALKSKKNITLLFVDGLAAYGSWFRVTLNKLTFKSEVETIYPVKQIGESILIEITDQQLFLNKINYKKGNVIKGYVSIEFVETTIFPNNEMHKINLNIKGFFITKIK